ncbi:MAG: hypothetical protein SOV58_02225 [Candidatus Enteromonas sp.]|nr:hypothetical protein [Candidatus Enteromonas sp.]
MGLIDRLLESTKNGVFNSINGIEYSLDIDKKIDVDQFRKKLIVLLDFKVDSRKDIVLDEGETIVVEAKTKTTKTKPFRFELSGRISGNNQFKLLCSEEDFNNDELKISTRVSFCRYEEGDEETVTIINPDGTREMQFDTEKEVQTIVESKISTLTRSFADSSSDAGDW